MKQLLYIGIGLLTLQACGNQQSDNVSDSVRTDSLAIETLNGQKDSLLSLVGEISNKLLEINELENLFSSKDFQAESPSKKKEMLYNIETIKNELADRRQRLEELESKLKKSNGYSSNLKKTIETQKQLIGEQSKKIMALEQELAKANIRIGDLTTRVDSLNTEVTNVVKAKEQAEQESVILTNRLNACYYIAATNKELKEKKILEKRFLGRTKLMEGDFDRDAFTMADKRTLLEIPTGKQHVKIVSKQPAGSYEIIDDNGYKTIKIINPNLFWEKSDFLVIEVK